MEPTFHGGNKVFVEKCGSINEGEIGIFIVDGEAYIKELGKNCLISHNSRYKPINLATKDSVYCCGRVIGEVDEHCL
jgi:phage repressor protein C with HTH and peptisase S24 domain